jgi:phage terminase large subunit GpA-like protein
MSLTSTEQWLDQTWRQAMTPEPLLTVSEWAVPTRSAEPGPWRTLRTPYLAEVMDSLSTGSPWERVVLMKGAQLGATEAALNWLGYIIHHAPGLALLVMPSLDMARRNTRTRLDPMIEATPALRELIATPRSRDAYNSAFTKSFPGGVLVMTGANSAAALRSTPARYLVLDEVDGFPPDCGGEGDPVALAIARTVTFAGRRKILLTSTPTVAGVSRIEKAYLEGDQRRYHVPCLSCGHTAPIDWKNISCRKASAPKRVWFAKNAVASCTSTTSRACLPAVNGKLRLRGMAAPRVFTFRRSTRHS